MEKTQLGPEQRMLISLATEVRKRAYAPYSQFQVGAALQCGDGSIFTGCNVEITNYQGTICAEHAAIVKAVSEGKKQFIRIAVIADQAVPCPPCGACRQALFEFAPKMEVISANLKGEVTITTLDQLLPGAFHL